MYDNVSRSEIITFNIRNFRGEKSCSLISLKNDLIRAVEVLFYILRVYIMSSFFRRASEITESEEQPDSASFDEDGEPLHQHTDDDSSTLRQDTLAPLPQIQGRSLVPKQAVSLGEGSQHKDLILHALLEEKCTNEALEHFNSQPGKTVQYTTSHPDVRVLAKSKYRYVAKHLGSHGLMAAGLEADSLEGLRHGYRLGLEHLSLESVLANDQAALPDVEGLRQKHRNNSAIIRKLPPQFKELLLPAENPHGRSKLRHGGLISIGSQSDQR